MGKCGKCLVRLSPSGERILACRTLVVGDADVYLPDEPEVISPAAEAVIDPDIAADCTDNPADCTDIAADCTDNPADCTDNPADCTDNPADCTDNPADCTDNPADCTANPADCTANTADCTANAADSAKPHPLHLQLGVAIDIGTTTVVAHIIDITTGTRLATASGCNAQRVYGADVISRIRYCAENGHEALTRVIREQLASLISETCTASGREPRDIIYVSIAGNTIMQHIAAGYSPVGMGTVPFTPVSLFGFEFPAWEGLPASDAAHVYFTPAVSSYVGGDITAGMLAAGLDNAEDPAVYLDIGTNGEIVLKVGNIFYCCATAAGPAFEGAEITMGMAAVSGAIDHVKWDDGLKISIIGNAAPRGICGSGLLDALAVLLDTGAVDETGRLLDAEKVNNEIATHISKADGKNVFRLTTGTNSVYLSAMDIRKLQLAKAAISAGIQTMLSHAGITEKQVKTLILAGGFGSFMDKFSAARIGLFPIKFLPVAKVLGNTAGEGAALALCSSTARTELEAIRQRCKYIELSTNQVFTEQFIEQMAF